MQTQISFGSSVKKNYKELKTLDPKLHILIYKCNGDKSELWARDGICTVSALGVFFPSMSFFVLYSIVYLYSKVFFLCFKLLNLWR